MKGRRPGRGAGRAFRRHRARPPAARFVRPGHLPRRELVSNSSHDLHTPLSNAQGYVETLQLAGGVAPRLEPFRRGELLQDVVQDGQFAARGRGLALSLAAGPALHACVRADIGLIERMPQTLVDIALWHTPRGTRFEFSLPQAA